MTTVRILPVILALAGLLAPGEGGQSGTAASCAARAEAAENRRDWPAAVEAYRCALSGAGDASRRVEALTGLSRSLLRIDDWTGALSAARRARAIDGDDGRVLAVYGSALFRSGDPEAARGVLDRAVAAAPGSSLAHMNLGRLLLAGGETERGIAELAAAHRIAPDDPEVVRRFAGTASTREEAIGLLERYLGMSGGEDPEKRESARATVDLYRALGETPVWVVAASPKRAKIPLWPLSRRADRLDGLVIELRATRRGGGNPRKFRCLLDSGASGLYLSEGLAGRLETHPLSRNAVFGGGGSGRHETNRVLLPRLVAGDLEFANALANVVKGGLDRRGRYDAIIGLGRFSSFRVTLDHPDRRMVLEDPSGRAGRRGDGPDRPPITVWKIEGQLLTRVGLNGQAGLMMVDTGATRTVLGLGTAAGLDGIVRRERKAKTHGFGGAVGASEEISGVRIDWAGRSWRDLSVIGIDLSQRSRLSGTEIAGYLGMDALAGLTLTFEPGQHLLRASSFR